MTSDKLLAVFGLFTLEEPEWTAEAAAERLGLAMSTTYRFFKSLTHAGLISTVSPGQVCPGAGHRAARPPDAPARPAHPGGPADHAGGCRRPTPARRPPAVPFVPQAGDVHPSGVRRTAGQRRQLRAGASHAAVPRRCLQGHPGQSARAAGPGLLRREPGGHGRRRARRSAASRDTAAATQSHWKRGIGTGCRKPDRITSKTNS